MIAWLKGEIIERQAPLLVINVNGIGYEVQAPMSTFYSLPEKGEVELYTHFVVREDAQQLFGFANKDERRLFRSIIKVNGVGPKLALTILSTIDPNRFVQCVQQDDVQSLVKVPGIGKKTAERLLIEMRDRLKDWYIEGSGELPEGNDSVSGARVPVDDSNRMIQEAESALIVLGYKPADASKMVMAVMSEEMDTAEALIKAALKRMA